MAKDYKKIYEEQFGKSNSPTQLQKNQKSINNLKARLTAGGVDPTEVADTRNWLEKTLNLTPDQNVVFDVFEILNRPQQALFGGIENMQNDGSFLEGAKEGISGNKDTNFKDILMNTGAFEDTTLSDASKESDSKLGALLNSIDLVDVLGMAGDVFIDPMDLPLIPVSAASKGAKIADTAMDTAKTLDKANDAIKFMSPTQALGKVTKGAIKTGAGVADTTLEKGLEKWDKSKGILYQTPNSKWATELGKIGDDVGKLESYKALKNHLTTMFDTKLSKTARATGKINDAKEATTRLVLEDTYKNKVIPALENIANKTGETIEQVDRNIGRALDKVSDINMRQVIEGVKDRSIKYSDEIYNKLIDIANDVPNETEKLVNGIKKGKNGILELSEDWEKTLEKFAPEKLDSRVKRVSFLSQKAQKEIVDAMKRYEQIAPESVQVFRDFYTDANKLIGGYVDPETGKQVDGIFSSMKGLNEKFEASNLEGFSKHKVADDYNENIRKLNTIYGVSPNEIIKYEHKPFNMSGTNNRTLNARRYNMSAEEANIVKKNQLLSIPNLSSDAKKFIKEDVNLFDINASSGIQEYINQIPRLAKNAQNFDEVILKQGFGDLEKMSALKRAIRNGENVAENTQKLNVLLDGSPFRLIEGNKPSYGFERLDSDTQARIVNFLKGTGNKTGNKELSKMGEQLRTLFEYSSNNIAIDPTVLNIIKFSTDAPQKNELAKMYNKLMNFFKGNATASVTNQMNNITGNMSNMYLSGMSMKDIANYSTQAAKDLSNWEDLIKKGVTDITQLTEDELRTYNRLKGFQENVNLLDKNSILKKYDIDGVMKSMENKKGAIANYVKFFGDLNANEDRLFKYAAYLKAMDDPSFVKNLGIETVDELGNVLSKEQQAGKAVGKMLFDPTDLTAFEQGTMKNIIPFYSYAKKNLAFQISNMGNNLQNYNKLMKTYNSLKDSYGDDYANMDEYFRNNMYIPIPGIDKDGNYTFIRTQLPIADLIDLTNDPIGSIVNKGNPFIKALYENTTNTNTFTGNDIESFAGEKSKNFGLLEELGNLVGADNNLVPTKKQEQLIGSLTGLNAFTRQIDRAYKGYKDDGILGSIGNQFVQRKNVNTDRLNRSYDEIQSLKDLMKQYEQKGYQFSTISELKKANKNKTIENIDAIFAKYGVGEKTIYDTGNKYYDYYMNNLK